MTPLNCAECNNPFVDGDKMFTHSELANGQPVHEWCFTEWERDLTPEAKIRMMGGEVDTYRPYE